MARFSDILMEHFQSPRNRGHLADPDLVGHAGLPGQGPYISISIRLLGNSVEVARFESNGCGVTIACGSILTELIRSRSLAECASLTADDISTALHGVPPDKAHCAALACDALRHALNCVGAGGNA